MKKKNKDKKKEIVIEALEDTPMLDTPKTNIILCIIVAILSLIFIALMVKRGNDIYQQEIEDYENNAYQR